MARIIALFAALLAACGSGHGLRPGWSTEADVRGALGAPAAAFEHADGSRTLAYPHGPLGTQTYMADVGADGRLRALRPVLNDDTFQAVVPGMTRE